MYHAYLLVVSAIFVFTATALAILAIGRFADTMPSPFKSDQTKFLHYSPPEVRQYAAWKHVPQTSSTYFQRRSNLFHTIYKVNEEDAGSIKASVLANEFANFYGLFRPTPPSRNHTLKLSANVTERLLKLNEFVLSTNETPSIRNQWAYSGAYPVVFPGPDEVPYLLLNLLEWIAKWVSYFQEVDGKEELIEGFCKSIVIKTVLLHPFHDANKRTARLLYNMLSVSFKKPGYIWHFPDMSDEKKQYQLGFTKAVYLGDYVGS